MADPRPLRVLIAGAGIGGLATAISLARISGISNIDVQLYEQAPELREIGASIALSPNGMRSLERLGVHEALADDAGFRGPSGIPQIFRHWKTDQVVSVDTHTNVPNRRHQTTRFHRGHLHGFLLNHVPRSSIHLNKKIERAAADENGVSLFFHDGTNVQGDVLIAADGIKSKVRQSLIPDYELRFTGKIFMRATFDASLVDGKVPGLPADPIHWWSTNENFFASMLGKGQYTTVGAYQDPRSTEELEKSIAWDQPGSVQLFKEKFKGWNPVVESLIELTPHVNLYPNYAGDVLSTWLPTQRVALLGDAAHTHGGAFAAGGSLALDDAVAIGLAFKSIASSVSSANALAGPQIQQALRLYDETRRPHATRLLNIVHSQLHKKPPVYASAEEEDRALIARFKSRPDLTFLSEHDVEKAFSDVLAQFDHVHDNDGQATQKETSTGSGSGLHRNTGSRL